MTVVLPPMIDARVEAWNGLLDVAERHPTGWTLVGGQMVQLHCVERGVAPSRPTDDVDAVLDVRAEPDVLHTFTSALAAVGVISAGESWQGHQHRWCPGAAEIDVLIPRHLGEKAAGRRGVSGGTTIETPGAQQALDRSEPIEVTLGERTSVIRRPDLLGALVAKAAAYSVVLDRAKFRHLVDFAVLATLLRPTDRVDRARRRDREYLEGALGALVNHPRTWAGVDGAAGGVARLRLALARRREQGRRRRARSPDDVANAPVRRFSGVGGLRSRYRTRERCAGRTVAQVRQGSPLRQWS